MNIYERRGIKTLINAKGPATRLSGGVMHPAVLAAMSEAAGHCVDMAELEAHASQVIADVTGAEAGYVASGAAACLLLATAACVTGLDPGRMARLPDTSGMKNEVIVVRSQRNFYDHAVRTAGVRFVEVGLPDRYAGAGIRDAEPWEIADAISERTAAVFYVADRAARPSLVDVVKVAHAAGVPVIVDAAAQLPPQGNLRRFITEGADLVAFSGGKAINGPQATGFLCGRRDLVMAAALQHLDLDILWEQWAPPPILIDKGRLKGTPQHGIGRPCKVGKEQIIGLLAALELFVAEGDEARHGRWCKLAQDLADGLQSLPGCRVELTGFDNVEEVPIVTLALPRDGTLSAQDLVIALQSGTPSIQVDPTFCDQGIVAFNPMCLQVGESAIVVDAVQRLNMRS
ncbi:aminotransferase class V-fold PLP-dependent enzyme [Dongia deserti]|uniref:aminotransferase class V-fold PLP-dependent enzyme n=1 Tax=Dongia deserti TaxID=2268030 RepID=UPI000E65016F|nr:aminotransferase class V-fold PLP-dependent enzyme [Dongia deserti]